MAGNNSGNVSMALTFHSSVLVQSAFRSNAMNDIEDYGDMELWCLQRARDEPENAWQWQGQAQRWREIADARIRNDFSKRPAQMTAGPMEMGPDPITGRRHTQQS
jgi:hypothetical protein